jgi:hypothetical protein
MLTANVSIEKPSFAQFVILHMHIWLFTPHLTKNLELIVAKTYASHFKKGMVCPF